MNRCFAVGESIKLDICLDHKEKKEFKKTYCRACYDQRATHLTLMVRRRSSRKAAKVARRRIAALLPSKKNKKMAKKVQKVKPRTKPRVQKPAPKPNTKPRKPRKRKQYPRRHKGLTFKQMADTYGGGGIHFPDDTLVLGPQLH